MKLLMGCLSQRCSTAVIFSLVSLLTNIVLDIRIKSIVFYASVSTHSGLQPRRASVLRWRRAITPSAHANRVFEYIVGSIPNNVTCVWDLVVCVRNVPSCFWYLCSMFSCPERDREKSVIGFFLPECLWNFRADRYCTRSCLAIFLYYNHYGRNWEDYYYRHSRP